MTVQTITTPFSSGNSGFFSGPGFNLSASDVNGAGGQPHRTPGTTVITPTSLGGPSQVQSWSVISATIKAYYNIFGSNFAAPYGQLGKILSALIPNYSGQGIGPQDFFSQNFLDLPTDLSLSQSLFDPTNDPLPPVKQTVSQLSDMLAVTATIYPTNPLVITPGEPLAAGIWMYPSLLGSQSPSNPAPYGLNIVNATVQINYDDGL